MSSSDPSASSPASSTRASDSERSGLSDQKRRDLADFLRSRREKMKPETVGIAQVSRRRTPGLRREEVAELAGVGTTWYTWLEQARDIQPSAEVLRRLAKALMMNAAETRHLFLLAGKAAPTELDGVVESAPESLMRLLEDGIQAPAYVFGIRGDILAANSRAKEIFPFLAELVEKRSNLMEHFFCTLERKTISDWETLARRTVAEFRASLSDSLDHPWVLEMIDSLRARSEDFDRMWKSHDVHDPISTIVEFRHDDGRTTKFERTILRVSDETRAKILILNPVS